MLCEYSLNPEHWGLLATLLLKLCNQDIHWSFVTRFRTLNTQSVRPYSCTSWTITKRLEKKQDGNYRRIQRAVLNNSWKQNFPGPFFGPPAPAAPPSGSITRLALDLQQCYLVYMPGNSSKDGIIHIAPCYPMTSIFQECSCVTFLPSPNSRDKMTLC